MKKNQYSLHNKIELLKCEPDFPDHFIQVIDKAKNFILMHNYICDEDEDTRKIFTALHQKAKEGIKVYVLLDAFGSQKLNDHFLDNFKHENFHFNFFERFFSLKFENFGRRLHQKVLIVDNIFAIIGGINLGKRFWNPIIGNPWVDYALYIEGEEVARITKLTQKLYSRYFFGIKKDFKNFKKFPNYKSREETKLLTYQNDWMRFKNDITANYLKGIKKANKEITLVASYFLPGKKFLKALAKKAASGVRVELILSGPTDVPLERWSRRFLYQWMLKKGIIIYEWDSSIVHAKIALIDNSWATVGSYNHNFISQYDNLEINTFIDNENFAKVIQTEIETLKKKATLYDLEAWGHNRNIFERSLEFFSYFLATIISFLSVTLSIRRKESPTPSFLE